MNAKLRSGRHERMLLWKRPSETTSLQRFTSYRAAPLLRSIFAALVRASLLVIDLHQLCGASCRVLSFSFTAQWDAQSVQCRQTNSPGYA
ncbi:hypothetical protein T07_9698 [Trichinella nelsoni]|uniref:Uncharacterized protein n=1 Tax=Trichinella nelsoni TaxID=6336 RepID=A0A0V0RGT7_9BILA|nr:hypothetical protein T07_9698 [Trichinella nelsoni]